MHYLYDQGCALSDNAEIEQVNLAGASVIISHLTLARRGDGNIFSGGFGYAASFLR